MNRIDPASIAEFFRAGTIKPVRGHFIHSLQDGDCWEDRRIVDCCGLTGHAIDKCNLNILDVVRLDRASTSQGISYLSPLLDIEPSYAYGFANGWDDVEMMEGPLPFDQAAYELGRVDGLAAWAATTEAISS